MAQHHPTFYETDASPYDVESTHDRKALFLATLVVAAVAYFASGAWPRWTLSARRKVSSASARADLASRSATACRTSPILGPQPHVRAVIDSQPGMRPAEDRTPHLARQAKIRPYQQPNELDRCATDRPFRFKAPDYAVDGDEHEFASPRTEQTRRHVQFFTPPAKMQPLQQQMRTDPAAASGWDPDLLDKCAASTPYISSVEALQCSPEYRSHISGVRARRLNYETAETHKLKVYRALRQVDPSGFQQLFSRQDVQEYDEVPPSRLLSLFECLSSSCLTLGLLLLPWLLPGYKQYGLLLATLWCCLYLTAASKGCLSPIAQLLSIHSTYGESQMLPSQWRMTTGVVLEAGLLVFTCGVGVLVTLLCRMVTEQRQSFAERVLQLVPMQEVVRPMHFNLMSPTGSAGHGWDD